MNKHIPVTEADLHAYLDKQLSEERHRIVEQWLNKHPEELRRLKEYGAITDTLKKRYDSVVTEPVPGVIQTLVAQFREIPRAQPRSIHFIAVLSLFVTGILIGWFSKPAQESNPEQMLLAHLVKPAAFAHAVYATDRIKPVEFSAAEESSLTHWLSDRMRTTITAPVLLKYGYRLIGGRLIPSTNRMAAQFMYENTNGKRITLYVRRMTSFQFNNKQNTINLASESGINTLFWRQGQFGYALSGDPDNKTLPQAANAARTKSPI